MTQVRYLGWAIVGVIVIACFWWVNQGIGMSIAVPTTRVAAAERVAVPPPPIVDSSGPRISYPPGHYPRLHLAGGDTHEIHSLLNVSRPLSFGDYVWNAKATAPGHVWVRIDLARQLLSVFRGGDEIGTAIIIYGAGSKPTPVGVFHIIEKSRFYYSHSYDAPMPFAMRLTADGVAIHASLVREHFATHGCVGLPFEFARLLYGEISPGDEVVILPDDPAA